MSKEQRNPTRGEVMSIIDEATDLVGNAEIHEIRFRLEAAGGWQGRPTLQQVRQVLNGLVSDGLVIKDGARQDEHYALTRKGKRPRT